MNRFTCKENAEKAANSFFRDVSQVENPKIVADICYSSIKKNDEAKTIAYPSFILK